MQAQDPGLRGAYELGRAFPGTTWLQWNSRFRDDVRRFVRGDEGMTAALMQRVYGSDDLFPDDVIDAYHAYQSINHVTSHDGFTLAELLRFMGHRSSQRPASTVLAGWASSGPNAQWLRLCGLCTEGMRE